MCLGTECISDPSIHYEPSRRIKSSGTGILSVSRVKTKPGKEAFSYYAPYMQQTPQKLQFLLLLNQG